MLVMQLPKQCRHITAVNTLTCTAETTHSTRSTAPPSSSHAPLRTTRGHLLLLLVLLGRLLLWLLLLCGPQGVCLYGLPSYC
jgi:hypothetical protein